MTIIYQNTEVIWVPTQGLLSTFSYFKISKSWPWTLEPELKSTRHLGIWLAYFWFFKQMCLLYDKLNGFLLKTELKENKNYSSKMISFQFECLVLIPLVKKWEVYLIPYPIHMPGLLTIRPLLSIICLSERYLAEWYFGNMKLFFHTGLLWYFQLLLGLKWSHSQKTKNFGFPVI